MPDAARPELRFLSGLSRGIVETPVLTSVTVIDTSSMVHLHSSHSFIPDRSIPAFSHDAHHNRSLRMRLRVVWRLHLIGDTEGPALITGTAWLIVSNYSAFLAHRQLPCPVGSSRPRELPPQALTEPYVRLSPHTALLIHRPSSIQNPNAQTTLAGFPDSA